MITIFSQKDIDSNNKMEVELRGLSTDTKPKVIKKAIVDNGSTFIEIDTGKLYMYDLENEQWKEI